MFVVSIYDGGYGDVNYYINGVIIPRERIFEPSTYLDIFHLCDNYDYDSACELIRELCDVDTIVICIDGDIFVKNYKN